MGCGFRVWIRCGMWTVGYGFVVLEWDVEGGLWGCGGMLVQVCGIEMGCGMWGVNMRQWWFALVLHVVVGMGVVRFGMWNEDYGVWRDLDADLMGVEGCWSRFEVLQWDASWNLHPNPSTPHSAPPTSHCNTTSLHHAHFSGTHHKTTHHHCNFQFLLGCFSKFGK